jgi:hypothetical protein
VDPAALAHPLEAYERHAPALPVAHSDYSLQRSRTRLLAPAEGKAPVQALYPASGFSRLVLQVTRA